MGWLDDVSIYVKSIPVTQVRNTSSNTLQILITDEF